MTLNESGKIVLTNGGPVIIIQLNCIVYFASSTGRVFLGLEKPQCRERELRLPKEQKISLKLKYIYIMASTLLATFLKLSKMSYFKSIQT